MVKRLAGCVIIDARNRILLIHRNTVQYSHWELPGGKIEPGETPGQAAIRELREELGVEVKIIQDLGGESFSDKNGEFYYFWLQAEIVKGTPRIMETDKFDAYRYFEPSEIKDLVLSANMQNLLPKIIHKEIVLTP